MMDVAVFQVFATNSPPATPPDRSHDGPHDCPTHALATIMATCRLNQGGTGWGGARGCSVGGLSEGFGGFCYVRVGPTPNAIEP